MASKISKKGYYFKKKYTGAKKRSICDQQTQNRSGAGSQIPAD